MHKGSSGQERKLVAGLTSREGWVISIRIYIRRLAAWPDCYSLYWHIASVGSRCMCKADESRGAEHCGHVQWMFRIQELTTACQTTTSLIHTATIVWNHQAGDESRSWRLLEVPLMSVHADLFRATSALHISSSHHSTYGHTLLSLRVWAYFTWSCSFSIIISCLPLTTFSSTFNIQFSIGDSNL